MAWSPPKREEKIWKAVLHVSGQEKSAEEIPADRVPGSGKKNGRCGYRRSYGRGQRGAWQGADQGIFFICPDPAGKPAGYHFILQWRRKADLRRF